MIELVSENINPTNIKVLGIGGAGCNAVNRMIEENMKDVEFIAINTDLQSMSLSKATHKIAIGENTTRGLGAGGNPSIGAEAAREDAEKIRNVLKGSNMVFITAGMGGGTGTGGAPVVAEIAKEVGALTVAVVTKPFDFEQKKRMKQAEVGIKELLNYVDTIITIPNQNLFSIAGGKSMVECFRMADSILMQGVKSVSEIITNCGFINVDFADVQTVMKNKGPAVMGVAEISMLDSEDKKTHLKDLVHQLIANPLSDHDSIEGAQGLLINITHGENTTMDDLQTIINEITSKVDDNADVISGLVLSKSNTNSIHVTLIATGFDATSTNEQFNTNNQKKEEKVEKNDTDQTNSQQYLLKKDPPVVNITGEEKIKKMELALSTEFDKEVIEVDGHELNQPIESTVSEKQVDDNFLNQPFQSPINKITKLEEINHLIKDRVDNELYEVPSYIRLKSFSKK